MMPHVRLSADARVVLLLMAMHARDDDEVPRYFMQREATCVALGRMVPDAPARDDPRAAAIVRERAAAFQRLKVVTGELVASGMLQRVKRGQRHQRAEYALTIPSPLDAGTSDVPLEGTRDVPLEVRETYPRRYARRTPNNHQESLKTKREEQHHDERASHVPAVDESAISNEAAA